MNAILASISSWFSGRKRKDGSGGLASEVAILCLLREDGDQSLIAEACRKFQWRVQFTSTVEQAQRLLARTDFQIVLLDRDLAGDDWREAMTRLGTPSGAWCILLVSKVFDDYLWNEVVRIGGYDVLAKPLRERDVTRALRLAWSYWMSANRPASKTR